MEKEIAFSIGGGIHSSKKRYFAQKDCVETPYNKPIRARIRVLDTLLGEIVYTSESVLKNTPHLKKDRGRYALKWKKEGDEYTLTDGGGKVVLRTENYVFDAIMVNGKIYLAEGRRVQVVKI